MMNNPPQPSDSEIQQTRLLVEFYEMLIEIESAFEQTEEVIQTKFAIANNFDLENPDTYLALISPVSRKIKNIANLAKLAHYKLIEYRELESKLTSKPLLTEPKYEPQPTSKPLFTQSKQKLKPHQNPEKLSTQKSSHLPSQSAKITYQSSLEIELESLKQKVERLELIVSLLFGAILGSWLIWVLFY